MLDRLRDLFSKQPQTLDDISLEDLQREKIRLEQQEKKLLKEISTHEGQKTALFNEGKAAKGSVHLQRSIALKIKSVDDTVKMTDRKLRTISKQLQAVNNFVYLKQSKHELEQSGLFDTINKMDIQQLDNWIERASIDGELNVSKLENMLQRINASSDLARDINEDPEIAQIMAMFQDDGPSLDSEFDTLFDNDREAPTSDR